MLEQLIFLGVGFGCGLVTGVAVGIFSGIVMCGMVQDEKSKKKG